MCLNSVFTQTTYTQDRFRHVHHVEIVPSRVTAHFQPDLSLSVFLERFSVYSSETCYTIRLFHSGVPKPLGTHVDTGSGVDHHQTFMGSWVPVPGCFSFFTLVHFATILAQVFDTDFVFNSVNVLLSRLGIGVLDFILVHHLVVICSWPTVSCEMTPFSAHVALFVIVKLSTAFAFAVVLAFAFAFVAVLTFSFALALAVAAAFAFALAFALALAFAFALALAYLIHVHWICLSEVIHDPCSYIFHRFLWSLCFLMSTFESIERPHLVPQLHTEDCPATLLFRWGSCGRL